ncbi:MAG: hypothetical protein J6I73_05985, partial [Treponema sp.]|nr:hypothetical protein [Treponema sp.]
NAAGEDVYGADYAWGYFKEDNSGAGARGAYRRTYEWNSRGQLIQSSDNDHTVYYVYGTDGERTNKFTSGSETLYFNSMWSWHKDSAIVGQYSKNIYLGTTRLVTKLHNDVNEMPSAQSVTDNCYYYHSDHLGSAQLITDFQGNEYQRLEYTPYGELWIEKTSPVKETKFLPYKFTGKERDEETGLYYYGARYLDAKYSRWLSADPALGEYVPQAGGDNSKLPGMGGVFNIVNLQLYHYAGNNPIRYTDPDGKQASAAVVQPDILDQTAQALITLGTVGVALPEPATTALGTAAFVIGVALINNGSHEHYIPEDLQISCNETTANVVMRDREGNPIPPANQPWPLKGRVNSGPEKISDPSAFGQPGKMPPNMKGPKGKIAAVLTAGALLIDAMKDKILDVANIKAKQKQGMPDAQVDVMSGAAPNMNAKQSENKEDKIIIKNWE